MVVGVGAHHVEASHLAPVERYADAGAHVGCGKHDEPSFVAFSYAFQLDVGFRATGDGLSVIELPSALIPCVGFHLVEAVAVVWRGIESADEGGAVHCQMCCAVFGQEVVAVVGIVVAASRLRHRLRCLVSVGCADVVEQCVFITHGSLRMEEQLRAIVVERHLVQVVGVTQIVGCKCFGLQRTAVAVNLHIVDVAESRLPYQVVAQVVDSRCRHAYLHPCALPQHRLRCVGVCGCQQGCFCAVHAGRWFGLSLHVKHEAHQPLPLSVDVDDGCYHHLQLGALAFHHYLLLQQCWLGRDGLVAFHFGRCHVDILGIFHHRCVGRVTVVCRQ